MKRYCLFLAAMLLGGCATLPKGVVASLETAQLSLAAVIADVGDAKIEPWIGPPGESQDAKLARVERQVMLLVLVMDQADRNLLSVIEYIRADKDSPFPTGATGEK